MVLLTFVWKCFQDRNFHGVVVGLYEQSIESWVGLNLVIPRDADIKQLNPLKTHFDHLFCYNIDLCHGHIVFSLADYVRFNSLYGLEIFGVYTMNLTFA